jgi:sugar/nucleoside kinase (ribokinase family)
MSSEHGGKSVDVVVVGSVGLDTIETPFERRERLLGGSVSYACVAASFFSHVGMVGIVGEDFPETYLDLYRGFGIDVTGLQRAAGRTFAWSGVYEQDMINRRTLSTELNVFADFEPVLPGTYRDAPYVLLGNIAPELQLHVLDQVRRPRFVVADTMDLWIDTAADPLRELIGRVDMLMLNDGEARQLTGLHNLRRCGARLLEWGPRYVVIKKGEHGSMMVSGDGLFLLPAFPIEDLHDPTGAGDTFAGAFVGRLASKKTLDDAAVRESLLCGSVLASFGVEAFSLDRLTDLSAQHIDERLIHFRAMLAAGN